jgi:hypothetical protein
LKIATERAPSSAIEAKLSGAASVFDEAPETVRAAKSVAPMPVATATARSTEKRDTLIILAPPLT